MIYKWCIDRPLCDVVSLLTAYVRSPSSSPTINYDLHVLTFRDVFVYLSLSLSYTDFATDKEVF